MRKIVFFLLLLLVGTVVLAGCQPKATNPADDGPAGADSTSQAVPAPGFSDVDETEVVDDESILEDGDAMAKQSVTVRDQAIKDGGVTVAKVSAGQAGWIVIHADNIGAPGTVIGQTAVSEGENNNVRITIDVSKATTRLYAMLHIDAGQAGTYEFPGADIPAKEGEEVVIAPFSVTDVNEVMIEKDDGEAMDKADDAAVTVKTFNLTGQNFEFSQDEIRVKKGDTVKIVFTSVGGRHDWSIDEFNARTERVDTNDTSEVTFVADQTGTFEYFCSVGSHRQLGMKGNLIVE